MKYDLQIIVPCVPDRLECFQRFGLYNIENRKVLVYCLVDDKNHFEKNWPENVDVEIVEFVECQQENFCKNNACYKLYKFLHEFTAEQANQAKWTLKIDDDCYNDIDGICSFLEKEFDYDRDYYIVAETRYEMDHVELNILKKLDLLEKINYKWEHEIECSITSRSATEKITNGEYSKLLFKEKYLWSIKSPSGYTDQCLGLAAKLCKIYPVENLGIITNGREHQLDLLFLNHKQRFERKDNLKNRFFCHFHPLKGAFYKKLLQIERGLREDEKDEKDSEKIQVKKIF